MDSTDVLAVTQAPKNKFPQLWTFLELQRSTQQGLKVLLVITWAVFYLWLCSNVFTPESSQLQSRLTHPDKNTSISKVLE